MRMIDIIEAKRDRKVLTNEQIQFAINGYTAGEIPDDQMSAFLMATYLNGMTSEETKYLTLAMAGSGDQIDLSAVQGVKVDKHSTGGVGDKTTLIVGPIVAACGVPVAKMSGRGLGHTGGTIDKLESIEGFQTMLSPRQFIEQVNRIGISVVGQSGNLAPADKKIYALRDVTATVDNLSLIASSIMSKKIAAGADAVLLDVKTGNGAFMKTTESACALAKEMIEIGKNAGRKVGALITNMNMPLGNAVGNSLEVIEATQTLQGNGPQALTYLCTELSTAMLQLAGKGSEEHCRELVQEALGSGRAFEKWKELVAAQGGNTDWLDDLSLFPKAAVIEPYYAQQDGYLSGYDTHGVGLAACLLGAGRETKDTQIDFSAGIVLEKHPGDAVRRGEAVAWLYTNSAERLEQAKRQLGQSVFLSEACPVPEPMIYEKLMP